MGQKEANIYGDLALSLCTSGFSVKNSAGAKGITTAGHCGNNLSYDGTNLPYFPKLVEQALVMEAETQGELVLENDCIRLKRVSKNDLLLIWPPRFELTVDGEDIRIRDDSGVSLSVGETIELGGGEKKIAHLKTMVEPPIPNHCPGPYWVIGVIRTP